MDCRRGVRQPETGLPENPRCLKNTRPAPRVVNAPRNRVMRYVAHIVASRRERCAPVLVRRTGAAERRAFEAPGAIRPARTGVCCPLPAATMEVEQPFMIDTVINLLFRCPHHRLTRPMAPITKAGTPQSQSYVVCLDCGKQFEYDLNQMRIGKSIDHSHEHAVVPPPRRVSPGKKAAYGVLAAVPVALLANLMWKGRRGSARRKGSRDEATRDGSA
jgi:hypothetical protein